MKKHEKPYTAGSIAIIHRHFAPFFFPATETGPAVIIGKGQFDWARADDYAYRLNAGESDTPTGVIKGPPLRTAVLSGFVLSEMMESMRSHFFNRTARWIYWRPGAPIPANEIEDFDALVVFQPKQQFPKLTVTAASVKILEMICGGGAVYTGAEVENMRAKATAAR